jgi:hypothetical protein
MERDQSSIEIRDVDGDGEVRRFAEIDAESFGGRPASNMRWLAAAAPHAPLRLAHVEGEVVAATCAWRPVSSSVGGRCRRRGSPPLRYTPPGGAAVLAER